MPPVVGRAHPTAESVAVGWITPDEVNNRMAPAYAVRILDALSVGSASRAHDGHDLLTAGHAPLSQAR
jgi:8-oxo-dGTP diphosphatase